MTNFEYKQLLDFEGTVPGGGGRVSTGTYTNASVPFGAGSNVQAGRALIVKSLSFACSEDCVFQTFMAFGNGAFYPAYPTGLFTLPLKAGVPLVMPVDYPQKQGMLGLNPTVLSVTKAGVTAPTAIPFTFYSNVTGKQITDDFNFDAPFILNIISDSIGDGSGMSFATEMWVFQVRNWFLSQGVNIRLRNWSVSGSTLVQHDNAFKAGRYNYREPGLTIICLGTNDAGGANGIATTGSAFTTSTNAFQSIIKQSRYLFPNQKKFVLGPSTLGVAQNETNLANIAAFQKAHVESLDTRFVRYIPRTTFTANVTNLQDQVHPTALAHTFIAQNVINYAADGDNDVLEGLI